MKSILIPEPLAGTAIDGLREQFAVVADWELWRSPERLQAAIPGFDALLVRNQTRVDAGLIAAASRLMVIGRAGAGLDNIDVPAASAAGIVVTYAPDASTNAVAELALGFILALARKLPSADRDTRVGGWDRVRFTGQEIEGRTLGLLGCGRIGRRLATKARALGMRLRGFDPYVASDDAGIRALEIELASLEEVLVNADFVSCHLPLDDTTTGLLDEQRLRTMKRGAFLVNTARGGIVDETALIKVLADGHLGGAALDVRADEPPAAGAATAALAAQPNVILTPHVGAFSHDAQVRVVNTIAADVRAILGGGDSRNAVSFTRPKRRP